MKSMAELEAIRQKTLENIAMRKEVHDAARVVVGMATCGIAAGARPVMMAFMDEIAKRHLDHVPPGAHGGRLCSRAGKGDLCQADAGHGAADRDRAHCERSCRGGIHHRRGGSEQVTCK